MSAAGWLLASYLLGAIPTSHLVSRSVAGIDLRKHGSRNLGATNLYRVLGWRYAVPVALFDAAKGAVPVLVFAPRISDSVRVALCCGIVAILGHVFSVFVRFRGGKGVATAAGVMLALTPLALLTTLGLWLVLVLVTGYVSLASVVSAAWFPIAVLLLAPGVRRELFWTDLLVALAIIWLHRANIRRLLTGTENRFGRHRTPATHG